MKQMQDVVKPQKWYKPFTIFLIIFLLSFIPLLFLIYNYLSYIQIKGVSGNVLLDFGNSLSMLFQGQSQFIGFSIDTLKNVFKCYTNICFYQILFILLIMANYKKPNRFKGIEHGSGRWATNAERKPFRNNVGYPLQENLVLSPNMKGLRNFNELVIGDSGTGKTFHKLIAELMQCYGNYIVVDVKGSLYKYCAKFLKQNGYTIKLLNLIDRTYSNTYNPLSYCKSQDDIDQLVETFIINSRKEDGKQGDEFWESSMEMLLKSIIAYLLDSENEEKTFARVLDLVNSLKLVNGTISPLSEFEVKIVELASKNPFHPAVLNYNLLKQAAPETLQGVLISLSSRLRLWTTEEVRILTMSDEIHIEDLLKEKQIIFLNIPQRTGAYKTISSMFLTQLFDTLYRLADEKYAGRLKIPVNVLLDEFANCGAITKFDSIISTCRSYNIRCVPCIQNKQQLEKLYNKAEKTIMSNCAILNYLGTTDSDTQKMISEKLGKATIEETNRSRNISSGIKGGSSESDRGMGRQLMTTDELNNMPQENSIVFISGYYPFFGLKYQTKNHKLYNLLGYDNIDNPNNTYAVKEYEELAQQHKAKYYEYISSSIENNKSIFSSIEEKTGQGSDKARKRNEDDSTINEQDNNQDEIRAEIEESIPQEFSIRDKLKSKMM